MSPTVEQKLWTSLSDLFLDTGVTGFYDRILKDMADFCRSSR